MPIFQLLSFMYTQCRQKRIFVAELSSISSHTYVTIICFILSSLSSVQGNYDGGMVATTMILSCG